MSGVVCTLVDGGVDDAEQHVLVVVDQSVVAKVSEQEMYMLILTLQKYK